MLPFLNFPVPGQVLLTLCFGRHIFHKVIFHFYQKFETIQDIQRYLIFSGSEYLWQYTPAPPNQLKTIPIKT